VSNVPPLRQLLGTILLTGSASLLMGPLGALRDDLPPGDRLELVALLALIACGLAVLLGTLALLSVVARLFGRRDD
jgi:hypothetical protein